MFVVGLAALFALGATSLIVASPALAKCNAECKAHKHEEKQKKREEKAKKKRERAEKKKGALEAKLKQEEEELAKLAAEKKTAEEKGETKVREEIARREAEIKAEKEALEKAKTEAEKEKKEREEKEKAQAELEKHEEEAGEEWLRFRHCPILETGAIHTTIEAGTVIEHEEVELGEVETCFWAQTNGTSEFKAGKVKVQLTNPITLQGGFGEIESGPNSYRYFPTYAPEDGTPELSPVAQPGPPLFNDVDEALLSPAEKALYQKDVEEGRTQTTVTIELATKKSQDVLIGIEQLLVENGPAFVMPVKVKLSSAFAGNHCYVGSETNPIWIYLTTGESGSLHGAVGKIREGAEYEMLDIEDNSLVENTFTSPGVEGCGGDATVDEAMDAALGLPSLEPGSNASMINGLQSLSSWESAKEHLERFHLPIS